ncbi:MAG: four helix bundle protein, partial [Chloroflexota bacterium]|nr:four helix bundle protein [Chloroflexota bacterium]
MAYQDIEESRMYERAERLADQVWDVVISWRPLAQDTVGKQLAKAVDSIGANIAESNGRFHPRDVINFLYYARGSLKETRYWLRRAIRRSLITQEQFDPWVNELTQLAKEINAYVGFQRKRIVKEPRTLYTVSTHPPTHPPNQLPTHLTTGSRPTQSQELLVCWAVVRWVVSW